MRDKRDARRAQAVGALTCTPGDVGSSGPRMPRMTTYLLPFNKKMEFHKSIPLCSPCLYPQIYVRCGSTFTQRAISFYVCKWLLECLPKEEVLAKGLAADCGNSSAPHGEGAAPHTSCRGAHGSAVREHSPPLSPCWTSPYVKTA